MSIPHSPYLFFALGYGILLAIGLQLSLLLEHYLSFNVGILINVVCFCAAIHIALIRPENDIFRSRWAGASSFIKDLYRDRWQLTLAFAFLAIATDIVSFALSTYHFRGEIVIHAPLRYAFVALAYALIAHVFIAAELRQKWAARKPRSSTKTALINAYQKLSATDKSAMGRAALTQGAIITTMRDTQKDLFLTKLEQSGFAERADKNTPGTTDVQRWTLTSTGLDVIRNVSITRSERC